MVDSTNLPNVDINAIATDLNGKMDRDGVNATIPILLSRSSNSNGGWTEVYSDGFCVQTGFISASGWITFDIAFIDTNYLITATQNVIGSTQAQYYNTYYFNDKETNRVFYQQGQNESPIVGYRIEGYIR